MSYYKEKVAIVTGGASGIGYAIVEHLLAEGVKVAVANLNETRLNELKTAHSGQVIGCVTNVTKEADIEALVEKKSILLEN